MDKVARIKFFVFDYLPKDEQYGLIYKAKIASQVKKSLANGYKLLIKKFAETTERLYFGINVDTKALNTFFETEKIYIRHVRCFQSLCTTEPTSQFW